MNFYKILIFNVGTLFFLNCSYAQVFKAQFLDDVSQLPISEGIFVERHTNFQTTSDSSGWVIFPVNVSQSLLEISLAKKGYYTFSLRIHTKDWNAEGQVFYLNKATDLHDIPIINLDNDESEDNTGDIYSLLSSSNDPLQKASAFQFSSIRFRQRGIENQFNQLGINGFNLNDFENDFDLFYIFSGQNILTKKSDISIGPKESYYDLDAIGVNQWIQLHPNTFNKEYAFNYSLSNRAYTHRIGLHYASGLLKKGFSIIAGANRRWAQEGFIKGTFYDAYGLYAGIHKSISLQQELQAILIYAPVERGKASPGTQEVYKLSDDKLYNSYWGRQEGEIRNSRIAKTGIAVALINYSNQLNNYLNLNFGLMAYKGSRSETRLDYADGTDPRPDYYQKLPSYFTDNRIKGLITDAWRNDENVRQVNWNQLYQINYQGFTTVDHANNNLTISGKKATYWLEQKNFNPQDIEHFGSWSWIKNRHNIYGGYRLEWAKKDFYLTAADLLGADFLVDLEDFANTADDMHPNINLKNHIVRKGDKYGFDYIAHHQKYGLWSQYTYKTKRIDLTIGGQIARVGHSREGKIENKIFQNSLGKSDAHHQWTYGSKVIATYKISGRQYIQAAGLYEKRALNFEQLYINAGWRPDVIPFEKNPSFYSADLSYFYRSPKFKLQLSGFSLFLQDQIKRKTFYLDGALESDDVNLADGAFVTAFYKGLNQQHIGLEGFISCDVGYGFSASLAGTVGEYIYTSRPEFLMYDQFTTSFQKQTIYFKNFYVNGTPQTALSLGLKYSFKRNGFMEINVNYFDDNYIEVNPLRRTISNTANVDRESPEFREIIDQQKLDKAILVNAFIFKGFDIGKNYCSVSLGVNNVLNSTDIISGGFEQFRFDYETKDIDRFPPKYYYLQGINYYLSLSYKID